MVRRRYNPITNAATKAGVRIQWTSDGRCRMRRGITLIETTVAAILLMVVVGMAAKVTSASNQAEKSAQQKLLAMEILSSLLEEKMSLPAAQLTPQAAAAWQLPEEANSLLTKAELQAEVVSLPGPPAGKQVKLQLAWQNDLGERTAPLVLSAFTFPRKTEKMKP